MTSTAPTLRDDAVARVFALDLGDARGAITRVLVLLERRCCRITRLELAEAETPGTHRLVVGVDAPRAMVHVIDAWLGGLVDVLAVEVLAPA